MESQVTTPHKQIHQRSQGIPFIEFLNLTSKWIIKSQRALLTQPSFTAQHTLHSLQRGSQPSNQGIHPFQLLVYASYHDFWILPTVDARNPAPPDMCPHYHLDTQNMLNLSFPHPASNARLLNLQRQDL